jgi:hypothetical protein
MTLHILACSSPPIFVLQSIERLFASKSDSGRKRHWMAWNRLCNETSCNGLGLISLAHYQLAFSYKLWWRFRTTESLWGSFLLGRYCPDLQHVVQATLLPSSSPVWRRLMLVKERAEECIGLLIRDGSSSFWFANLTLQGSFHSSHSPPDSTILSSSIIDFCGASGLGLLGYTRCTSFWDVFKASSHIYTAS